ncbi:DUF6262 family protein [Ureibacillus sp. MALMAid1270]|uniref:DUF6262 family protein n=1 Tax=Ureibacillus sp. MALMAid1270 TaxID=3411629 RepID=UPI003BA49912
MKKLPESLIKLQEQRREETLRTIQNAIDTLKEEGTIVTKKLLIELSGYSASTFSKPHVKELLERNEVCQFRKRVTVQQKQTLDEKLKRKNEKLQKKCNLLESRLLEKDIRLSKLEEDLEEEKEKNKRLLGKLHEIMRKAEMKGIQF